MSILTKTPIQAIVFDMDGTLFDTESMYCRAFQRALADQSIPLDESFYHRELAGTTNLHIEKFLSNKHGASLDLPRYQKTWHTYLHEEIDTSGLPFMPEIKVLLEQLQEKNIPLAIASSSDLVEIRYFLKKSNITHYFTVIAAGDEVEQSKPAPDIFLLAAKRLSIPPANCLAIEDSNHGVKAASDAGMQVAMVPGPAGANASSQSSAHLPEKLADFVMGQLA